MLLHLATNAERRTLAAGSIFISYRRADTSGHAGRLYDRLSQWFDDGVVFYDRGGIDSGDDFPLRLQVAVDTAKVVLVLIGPDWQSEINKRARQPGVDYVRLEVELALKRLAAGDPLKVVPVQLGGAASVHAHALDEILRPGLAPLNRLDTHVFQGKDADWQHQFIRLRDLLAAVPGVPRPRFRPPAGTPQPFRTVAHRLSPHFKDPNDLLTRLHAMLPDDQVVAVFGMAGVGKTQLALKYSHSYRDLYAGVWWLRAETESTLQFDAHDACLEVGATITDGEPPATALKRWLDGQRGGPPWLLVFDNAEDPATLRAWLPDAALHHVLITSRNPAWAGLAAPLATGVWTDEQGWAFLASRLPGRESGSLRDLSRALGGLPLALEQAAAFIDDTGMAVDKYTALVHAHAPELLEEDHTASGYEQSVLATLSIAFPRLDESAAQLLRLLACLAPEPVPESLFREYAQLLPEALAAAMTSPLGWDKTVGALRRFGLVDRQPMRTHWPAGKSSAETTESTLSIHRLTQAVVRHCLAANPGADVRCVLMLLREGAPADVEQPANWPFLAAIAPHVLRLCDESEDAKIDRRTLSWLLNQIGTYLARGPALFEESFGALNFAVAMDKADLGEEHNNTLTSMGNLASTLWNQGKLAGARKLQEQVLHVACRVLGEEHPNTLTSMSNLAGTLWNQGDFAGARKLQEQILEVRRRALGEEHPETLRAKSNLALTLEDQGDLAGARKLGEQVFDASRRVLGEKHPGTLTSMSNLAITLANQGDLAGARKLQEQALDVRRRVLGEEHPDTLTSTNNLAFTFAKQGDVAGGRELQEQVLDVRRRVLGEEHPNTLILINNLADTLTSQGDLTGARKLQKQALDVRQRALGEEHPDTLTSMNNLAATLWNQGDLAGARKLQEQVLVVRQRVLGEEHPATLTSMNNLASTLKNQGDLVRARKLEEQALDVRRRVQGEAHPDTLNSMNNLAITFWQMGRHSDAKKMMTATVEGMASKLGRNHPDTQAAMQALAAMTAETSAETDPDAPPKP